MNYLDRLKDAAESMDETIAKMGDAARDPNRGGDAHLLDTFKRQLTVMRGNLEEVIQRRLPAGKY